MRQGRSVTVEDELEDNGGLGDVDGTPSSPSPSNGVPSPSKIYTESHPSAGKIYGKGRTIMEEIDDKEAGNSERKNNIFYPFVSRMDFEMGAWLSQSNVSMSQIDDFLKLDYVCFLLLY